MEIENDQKCTNVFLHLMRLRWSRALKGFRIFQEVLNLVKSTFPPRKQKPWKPNNRQRRSPSPFRIKGTSILMEMFMSAKTVKIVALWDDKTSKELSISKDTVAL